MASQTEVFDFIKKNYKHEQLASFNVKIQVPLRDRRSQTVYVAVTETELQVTSPFAWQGRVSSDKVFEENKSMFGIVTVNGAYALKHNAYIADIDESEIENAFIVLGAHADLFERSLGFTDEF
jgi:hypothetical protein